VDGVEALSELRGHVVEQLGARRSVLVAERLHLADADQHSLGVALQRVALVLPRIGDRAQDVLE